MSNGKKVFVGFLNEEELKSLRQEGACKAACEKLIKELIAEWEKAYSASDALWDVLIKKYDPEGSRYRFVYSYDAETKSLEKREIVSKRVEEMVNRVEERDSLMEYFKKLFGTKKGDEPKP